MTRRAVRQGWCARRNSGSHGRFPRRDKLHLASAPFSDDRRAFEKALLRNSQKRTGAAAVTYLPLVERASVTELLAGGMSRGALRATFANHTATALYQMRINKPDALAEAGRVVENALAAGDKEGSAAAAERGYEIARTAGGAYDRLRMHTIWGAQLTKGKDRKRAVEVLREALRENWVKENEVALAWTNNITAAFNLALNARDCSLVPEALGHVRVPLEKMERTYRAQYRIADGICKLETGDRTALRRALDESVAEGGLSKTGEAYRFSEEILAGKR